ncbi:MAG: preprotein translocase subunit YajC [Desulfobulbaceae bacterium A2]|nr:MAG: preprotein translocase subunit YajC [Desulfobulbaceae bacterium A2]
MFSLAHAAGDAAPSAAPGGQLMSFVPLVLIFVVFYFLIIRPQQKKAKDHQNFLSNLKKDDEVVTSGGLYGVVTGLTDSTVSLQIAEGVRVKVSRGHILMSGVEAKKQGEAPAKKAG